ncbi:TIGR03084 family metal-binding protein [Streptomyces sp. RB6PN25]|uniref:TIGR03084 family metal-binding protein n=1 Tax=Streptomyces humicola TaxID=2953240 RepID=A0ABT1Q476_9ACTN|nr:TIGR03084 family metal-binding protein [Streptomyces humicola]MCQ4084724.1 TIGR03084 family metal-binding protein [Streptomyces humicola]
MADPGAVLDDLSAESAELDALVTGLAPELWARPTPAPGWSVAHQIAHLAWTDERALQAAADPEGFAREVRRAVASGLGIVDAQAQLGAGMPPAKLLARWREGREALLKALRALPSGARLPWFGPSMGVAAMASARIMETWAHGQDVADALGVCREPTARLRHVAWIGVRTRDFAFVSRGLNPPAEEFRVELVPVRSDDAPWVYGPRDAAQRVVGPALDFCLLVTQRVHRDDTGLAAEGPDAERWLGIAQAFAGPPGPGREPKESEGRAKGPAR